MSFKQLKLEPYNPHSCTVNPGYHLQVSAYGEKLEQQYNPMLWPPFHSNKIIFNNWLLNSLVILQDHCS
jgi:hypothetical protein